MDQIITAGKSLPLCQFEIITFPRSKTERAWISAQSDYLAALFLEVSLPSAAFDSFMAVAIFKPSWNNSR